MARMKRSDTVAGTAVQIDEPDDPAACRGTVVLLHGWPDNAALWDGTVAALSPQWRCVRFTLPGFAEGDPPGAHTLEAVAERLHQVVRFADGGRPVTLLLHDWGCLFGYHFLRKHPELVARVIGVDIGDAGSRAHQRGLPLKGKLGIVAYQLWLALAWRIGGALGDGMARRMASKMRVPAPQQQIRAQMGYPYWITWTGSHGSYRAARPFAADEPRQPMCFIYGQRKPFQFQSREWLEALAARPGCRVVPMKTGHWVMLDAPQAFHAAVLEWLDAG
jgi:pimeloyl-ACP methyl ester carboxylesterase